MIMKASGPNARPATSTTISLWLGEAARVSLVTYLILLFIESVQTGIVSNFLNLNVLLGLALVTGLLAVFFPEKEIKKELKKRQFLENALVILVGVAGMVLVYSAIRTIGSIAFVVAFFAGLAIMFVGRYIASEDVQEEVDGGHQ